VDIDVTSVKGVQSSRTAVTGLFQDPGRIDPGIGEETPRQSMAIPPDW
jgi:hypothetical protein